jgi:hypothetical protein
LRSGFLYLGGVLTGIAGCYVTFRIYFGGVLRFLEDRRVSDALVADFNTVWKKQQERERKERELK